MKSKMQWLLIGGIMVLMSIVGWTAYAQKKRVAAVTWEYKAVALSTSYPVEKEMNAHGAQGWELVEVGEVGGATYYFYKRAK